MPSHSKSKLQAVLEESTSTVAKNPSVTTAVKNMASVLLGPRGKTPIENIMTMQHFQLWGFILVVAGLIYIVWLMQKKLDSIDKQYKEQFVLLHRLFKSHQDLQVEVRKRPQAAAPPAVPVIPTPAPTEQNAAPVPAEAVVVENKEIPTTQSLSLEDEEEIQFETNHDSSSSSESVESSSDEEDESGEDDDESASEVDYEEYDVEEE